MSDGLPVGLCVGAATFDFPLTSRAPRQRACHSGCDRNLDPKGIKDKSG